MDTVDSLCTFCSENFESAADCAAYWRTRAARLLRERDKAREALREIAKADYSCNEDESNVEGNTFDCDSRYCSGISHAAGIALAALPTRRAKAKGGRMGAEKVTARWYLWRCNVCGWECANNADLHDECGAYPPECESCAPQGGNYGGSTGSKMVLVETQHGDRPVFTDPDDFREKARQISDKEVQNQARFDRGREVYLRALEEAKVWGDDVPALRKLAAAIEKGYTPSQIDPLNRTLHQDTLFYLLGEWKP